MTASTSIRRVFNSSQLKVDRPISFVEYSYKRTRCFAKTLNKGRRSFISIFFFLHTSLLAEALFLVFMVFINEKLLKYKTYKNKLTDLLRVAKRLYFQNQIELNKTNIKQTWRILNNAIGQNKKKKLTYPLVDENKDPKQR